MCSLLTCQAFSISFMLQLSLCCNKMRPVSHSMHFNVVPFSLPVLSRCVSSLSVPQIHQVMTLCLVNLSIIAICFLALVCILLMFIPAVRRPWTDTEREVVLSHMAQFVALRKVPGKSDIEPWLANESRLTGRSWHNVKDFIRNKIVSPNSGHC
jgi:hypothetical protein